MPTDEIYALIQDVTPARASVYFVGSYQACRARRDARLELARVDCSTPDKGERVWIGWRDGLRVVTGLAS